MSYLSALHMTAEGTTESSSLATVTTFKLSVDLSVFGRHDRSSHGVFCQQTGCRLDWDLLLNQKLRHQRQDLVDGRLSIC